MSWSASETPRGQSGKGMNSKGTLSECVQNCAITEGDCWLRHLQGIYVLGHGPGEVDLARN